MYKHSVLRTYRSVNSVLLFYAQHRVRWQLSNPTCFAIYSPVADITQNPSIDYNYNKLPLYLTTNLSPVYDL